MTRFGLGRSLFWTIAAIFLLTTVVGTLLQALVASAVLQPLEAREAKARAELAASAVAGAIAAAPSPPRGADLDSLLERQRETVRPAWIVFRGTDGTIASAPAGRFIALEGSRGDSSSSTTGRQDARGRFEIIARRAVTRGPTVIGEVQVMRRNWSRGAMGIVGSRNSILLFPIAIIASAFAGLVLVRLLVRRLHAMEILAARVAEGDLTVRLTDRSGDEIGRLAEQQLFADITHELATPLTSIRGYAETMLDPGVSVSQEERTQYVRGLLDESRRMDLLIRDLFELARLEAGAPLSRVRLDWAALCRNTIERFEPRFRRAGLSLSWNQSAHEAWIEADGHRMEQVLENLLVNALRYVPEGGAVQVELTPESGERFGLTVRDNGPGIPAEELPLVFKRFYRGAGSSGGTATDQGGSGLGLAIVREIVERHGGTVRARANTPRGLAITVELPGRGPETKERAS